MATARNKLREELSARFVPLLRQRGFAGPDRIAGNALFHDFRRSTAAGTQVLSIQFEKYQRPRCILNLWVEPQEGVDAVINRGGAVIQGRVQPRRGASIRKWFRADHPWWQRMLGRKSTREREAVSEAIALLDEIDRFWQQPLLFVVVFGYLLPRMGFVGRGYGSALLPGILAVSLALSTSRRWRCRWWPTSGSPGRSTIGSSRRSRCAWWRWRRSSSACSKAWSPRSWCGRSPASSWGRCRS